MLDRYLIRVWVFDNNRDTIVYAYMYDAYEPDINSWMRSTLEQEIGENLWYRGPVNLYTPKFPVRLVDGRGTLSWWSWPMYDREPDLKSIYMTEFDALEPFSRWDDND